MRHTEFTRSGRPFQQGAIGWLVQTLGLHDYQRKLPAGKLAQLLVMASALGCSLSAVVQRLRKAPSDETVRRAMLSHLELSLPDLETRITAGLQTLLPRRFFRKAHYLALDLHQRPYYGVREKATVCGGKRKDGTRWFWTWATVAVVERGQRWTLAVTLVRRGEPLQDVVGRLLRAVRQAKIPVKLLLLDRGFYSAEVIEVLQGRRMPFLMPAIRRGRVEGAPGPTGTARFFQPGTQGFFQHQWSARGRRHRREVRVGVACAPPPEKRRTRGGKPRSAPARPQVFIFHGWKPPSVLWCREIYRCRFGIETSYRQLGQGLAQTTTRNDRWRLLLVGAALLLRNLWVWCNQHAPCGNAITLSLLLHQLEHYISQCLELIQDLPAHKRLCHPSP